MDIDNNKTMASGAIALFAALAIYFAFTSLRATQKNVELKHEFNMYDFNSAAVPDSTLFEVSMVSDSTGDTLSLGAYYAKRLSIGSLQKETLDTTALIPVFAGTDTILVVTVPWNGYVYLYIGNKQVEENKREKIIFTHLIPFRRPE